MCCKLLLEEEHVLQADLGKKHVLERKSALLEAVGKCMHVEGIHVVGMHVAGCCWIGNACCRLLLDRECMLQAAAG